MEVGGEGCGGWRRGKAARDLEQRWERSWAGRTEREEIESDGERREKNKVMREEREKRIKKILNQNGISVHTLSYLRAYCSMSQNFETFSTLDDALFLVFGVPNAKYLAFGTPDENALMTMRTGYQLYHLSS